MQKLLKLRKYLNPLLKYLVAAVVLAVPLYPKFPFIQVPGTFVSIRLEDFLIGILGLTYCLAILPEIKATLKDSVNKSILLYLLVGFVSLLSAVFLTNSVGISIGTLHWLRRIEYVIPFFASYYVVRNDRESIKFYAKLLLIVIFFAFIYGLGQKYLQWPIIITQNQEYAKGIALRWIEGSHINSTFAGHYDLASFLVLVLPVVAVVFTLTKSKYEKLVTVVVFAMGVWLMASAVSRISIVSYLAGVSIALFLVRKYKMIPVVIIASLIIFSQTSSVVMRYERIYDVVKTRIESMTSRFDTAVYAADNAVPTPPPDPRIEGQQPSALPEDRSSSIRFNVEWPRALRALSKNPLLGTGFSSITLATDNDYLRALGETGLMGFAAFMLIFVRLFRRFMDRFPFDKSFSGIELAFVAGVFAAMPGIFLNAVFIDIFEASKFAILFWTLMGMATALLTKNNLTKKSISNTK